MWRDAAQKRFDESSGGRFLTILTISWWRHIIKPSLLRPSEEGLTFRGHLSLPLPCKECQSVLYCFSPQDGAEDKSPPLVFKAKGTSSTQTQTGSV